jgi:hypothetical protein
VHQADARLVNDVQPRRDSATPPKRGTERNPREQCQVSGWPSHTTGGPAQKRLESELWSPASLARMSFQDP